MLPMMELLHRILLSCCISESVSYWLGAGADPNGLSSDQQATALTAAVSHRRRGVLKVKYSSTHTREGF